MRDTLGKSDIILLTADLKIRPQLPVIDTRGSAEPDDEGVERLAAAIKQSKNITTFNGINLKDQREGKLSKLELPRPLAPRQGPDRGGETPCWLRHVGARRAPLESVTVVP